MDQFLKIGNCESPNSIPLVRTGYTGAVSSIVPARCTFAATHCSKRGISGIASGERTPANGAVNATDLSDFDIATFDAYCGVPVTASQ